jgi:hypothetical protein
MLRTHTRPGDLRLNSYSAIVEPLGGHLFMYVVSGHEGATSVTSGSRDPADRLGREAIKSTIEYEGSI